MVYNHSSSY